MFIFWKNWIHQNFLLRLTDIYQLTHNMTQHVLNMFWAGNFHVLNSYFNEQSVVIFWVSWCKNKSFWQRFTCTGGAGDSGGAGDCGDGGGGE